MKTGRSRLIYDLVQFSLTRHILFHQAFICPQNDDASFAPQRVRLEMQAQMILQFYHLSCRKIIRNRSEQRAYQGEAPVTCNLHLSNKPCGKRAISKHQRRYFTIFTNSRFLFLLSKSYLIQETNKYVYFLRPTPTLSVHTRNLSWWDMEAQVDGIWKLKLVGYGSSS